MGRVQVVAIAVSLLVAAPARAQLVGGPEPSLPPQTVELSVIVRPAGNANISAHGTVVRGAAQCVVVTAAHVLGGFTEAEWSDPTQDLPSAFRSAVVPFADDGTDVAIIMPDPPISNCASLPDTMSVGDTLRSANFATVVEATGGGAVNQLGGQIVGRSPSEFALVTEFEVGPGLSGAPVTINGQPVGVVLGGPTGDGLTICKAEFPRPVPFRSGHELCVRRIDYIAAIGDARLLRQTSTSVATGDGDDGVDGNRQFWEGAGLLIMGRQRSARLKFELAGRQGSAAGWLQVASMQQDGEGGPRDAAAASALTSKYLPALFTQAESSPAAVFTLLGIVHKGTLSPTDTERAKGAIIRGYQAIAREAAAGDSTAATWQVILNLGDLQNSNIVRALARKMGVPEKAESDAPLLGNGCADVMCFRRQITTALQGSIKAMEQGSDIAALFLGASSTSLLSVVAASSLNIPECGLLRSLDPRNPLRNAAIASCTVVRRAIALRQLSLLAFDEGQDYQIWKAALNDRYFGLKNDSLFILGASNPNATADLVASQRIARDEELNREAGLALVKHGLATRQVTAQDVDALIAYVDGSSPDPDDENRGEALGTLFAVELLYGYPQSPAAIDATVRAIHDLNTATINDAIDAITRTAEYWPLDRRKAAPGFMSAFYDIVTFAASKGAPGAIGGLIALNRITPAVLRYAPYSRLHTYLQAAARNDMVGMTEIVCLVESLGKFTGPSHEAAVRFCEAALDYGISQAAEPLRRIYNADGKPDAARSAFERGNALGATNVLWGVLDGPPRRGDAAGTDASRRWDSGVDPSNKLSVAMALVARGDAEGADALMFRMISGELAWQPADFQYAARFLTRSGVTFECVRAVVTESACQLTGLNGKVLGNYGGAIVGSTVPIVSEDKYQALVGALGASGAAIHERIVPRPSVGPSGSGTGL